LGDEHIPWTDHAHRAIKKSWYDDTLGVDAKAFRRRASDTDGLSVASSHEGAKVAFQRGHGVAKGRIEGIREIGLGLEQGDDGHGVILGVPMESQENYNEVMEVADRLVRLFCEFTHDPWKSD
jgi:hypothetical protein